MPKFRLINLQKLKNMLNQSKLLFKPIALIIFTFLFTSCSDSKTGVKPRKPVHIPQLDKIVLSPNLNYFKIDSSTQPESNFKRGKDIIQDIIEKIHVTKKFYNTFLAPATSKKPVFKDGRWLWTYKSNSNSPSRTQLKLTASENGNKIIWNLYYSNMSNKGQKILSGRTRTTNINSHQGIWQIYPSTDSLVVFKYSFKTSEFKRVGIRNHSYGLHFGFQVSFPNHSLFKESNKSYYGVSWNTQTGTGYLFINKQKKCWNANYQNIQC